ncbi:MAG: methyltransferase domain-containing protein [Acidimicrobiia bacterium]
MPGTADAFAERVFASALGAIEIYSIHIGDRLGFYKTLVGSGGMTCAEVAAATGVHHRYVQEWLEQQATNGILDADQSGDVIRFCLPQAHAEVLAEELNNNYLAPLARMLTTSGESMALLLDAYRTGGGVSWDRFGQDMRESQADMNRPFFMNDLADVLGGIDALHDRLDRSGARIADVGCGAGWSTLALARAYPDAEVVGYDIDAASIDMARLHAANEGFGERVTFHAVDVGELAGQDSDVAFAFECIHDMPQPVRVLAAMHEMVGANGAVVVMDEAVGDAFTGEGNEIERLMYGFSLLVCLPDGLSSQPSVGTGTVLRPAKMRAYGEQAGFTGFRTLTEAAFFRFYELTP